jgi:hypothetical protein
MVSDILEEWGGQCGATLGPDLDVVEHAVQALVVAANKFFAVEN